MNLILFMGLLASASAAPRWRRHDHLPPPPPSPPSPSESPSSPPSPLRDIIKRYLIELEIVLKKYENEIIYNSGKDPSIRKAEMEMFSSNTSSRFFKDFPKYTEEIEGNEYIITLCLIGYDKNDFVVRTRNGRLLVEVRHNFQGSITGYGHDRMLPACVGELANWSYENDLLKIVFPVVPNCDSGTKEPTPENVTPGLDRSRETESLTHDSARNIDVDLVRGDLDKAKEIQTKDTPNVAPRWRRDNHLPPPPPSPLSLSSPSLPSSTPASLSSPPPLSDDTTLPYNLWHQEVLKTLATSYWKDYPEYTGEIIGNEYIITISLIGFDKKDDFVVRTSKGRMEVQVTHYFPKQDYDKRLNLSHRFENEIILPACVGELANWSYENDLLKIVLPVAQNCDSGNKEPTPETVTPGLDRSRETGSLTHDNARNADVDLVRGDLDKTKEIQTNDTHKA